ncbi:DNA-directed RNA polymerase V subunit 7-like isoform X1 [Actinidia eriantha]|uniref:DNA-directed RNA polymerase V subunit 7-like isoform X1 n=2 Tax=Actinidia eriantha TaxID=165200 RepID=UPI00258DB409|nr:DNA-directed RNA polymerase V subunit 7-like isoform X1 [Actinidia eriantha]
MQITKMFREMEVRGCVAISIKSLDRNGVVNQSSVVTRLLKELLLLKSTEEHGYFLAVTKLKSIGNGEFEEESRDIRFPVSVVCRTFLPVRGDIMLGVVHKIYRSGVFLQCGPMKFIYLSARKMPNFYHVQWKTKEVFMNDNLSRIENDVVIRFVVFATRWRKKDWNIEREFMILASIEGDGLGPVSLPGSDALDF